MFTNIEYKCQTCTILYEQTKPISKHQMTDARQISKNRCNDIVGAFAKMLQTLYCLF